MTEIVSGDLPQLIVDLPAALAAEVTARTTADTALADDLAAEVVDRTAAVLAEAEARAAADSLLADVGQDPGYLRDVALRQLIREAHGIAIDPAQDPSLLRDIALRQAIRDQAAVSAGPGQDPGYLRDVALRQLIREARTPLPVATDAVVTGVDYSVSGRVLTVHAGRTAIVNQGRTVYPGGAITIPAPSTAAVTGEAVDLVYLSEPAYVFSLDVRLAHPNVRNLVVSGTTEQYILNEDHGVISRLTAGDAVAVTVNYDWSMARYDIIEADTAGALYRVAGTERERDVIEYVPSPTPGRVPLLLVRTTAWEITVLPWVDPERAALSAPALLQRGRARRLHNLRRALHAGNPVTIAGYGDSRTNLGGTSAIPYAPNGDRRDILTTVVYLATAGADFVSTLPLYDHGDGAGRVHTHVGWNWDLLRALQAQYPGAHQYLNFGIGGTTSGNTEGNGTFPARLAGLTGSGATIAVVAFGMNELGAGAVDTVGNLVAIGEACHAVNIDVVFIAPARVNKYNDRYEKWLVECQQNRAAADYLSAPYIDPVSIYGSDEPYIDPRDCCASNLYNHDSVYELNRAGSLLSRIVLDL